MQCNLTACCTPVEDALNAVVKGCSTSTTLDCTCLLINSQKDKCAGPASALMRRCSSLMPSMRLNYIVCTGSSMSCAHVCCSLHGIFRHRAPQPLRPNERYRGLVNHVLTSSCVRHRRVTAVTKSCGCPCLTCCFNALSAGANTGCPSFPASLACRQ